jgi:hypothetical protein
VLTALAAQRLMTTVAFGSGNPHHDLAALYQGSTSVVPMNGPMLGSGFSPCRISAAPQRLKPLPWGKRRHD